MRDDNIDVGDKKLSDVFSETSIYFILPNVILPTGAPGTAPNFPVVLVYYNERFPGAKTDLIVYTNFLKENRKTAKA